MQNKNILVTGRGATSIYLILNQHFAGKEVIIPSNICYAAVLPIIYSGNIPIFIDVSYPSGNMTYENIKSAITTNTGAVLFPHMYGNVSDEVFKIKTLCKEKHLLLIEDCASAMGGTFKNGTPVGTVGDYAIFSTGHSKNVDLDNGGIIVSNSPLDDIKSIYDKMPIFTAKIAKKEKEFSNNYSKLRHTNQNIEIFKLFSQPEKYSELFLYRLTEQSLIEKIAQSFNTAIKQKPERLKKYQLFLNNLPRDICYIYNEGSMPWRFSVLIKDPIVRKKIIQQILHENLFVSDWYPCIAPAFDITTLFSNASRMEHEILNFSLLDAAENILRICDIIKLNLQDGVQHEEN